MRQSGRYTALALCLVCLCAWQLPAHGQDTKGTVKLVELIQKKQFDAFTKELSREDMDVNQPTPSGKLPIIEAIKTKDAKFVDALIQYAATVNVKEPGTGASPVMLAFQANLVDISKMLLAYGADPTVAAKNNKKASDVMPSSAIKELFATWEKDGAMAFEDAPGTWSKATDENGVSYWFNREAKEGRWNMPPSCAWQRVEHKDAPAEYVNYVTGQTVRRIPRALAWARVRSEGTDLWYNWAINVTQHDQPDEPPQYMIDEAVKNMNVRWYNEKTQEFSWEDPKARVHWRPVAEGDQTYYYNVATGESQWEVPDELAWAKHEHESGPFWHNHKTGDSTWDVPDAEAWVKHDSDL